MQAEKWLKVFSAVLHFGSSFVQRFKLRPFAPVRMRAAVTIVEVIEQGHGLVVHIPERLGSKRNMVGRFEGEHARDLRLHIIQHIFLHKHQLLTQIPNQILRACKKKRVMIIRQKKRKTDRACAPDRIAWH
jgi:hypothetical protein